MQTLQGKEEKIYTGLTPNYLSHWSPWNAMREIAQNFAWVQRKTDTPVSIKHERGLGIIEDNYTGICKTHLYIGEGEQREDSEGLGWFGEGLKMALLIFARHGINHYIETKDYKFWGELEKTPHGTFVLVIKLKPIIKERGTKFVAAVSSKLFYKAIEGFAPLQEIDMPKHGIVPDRSNEIWIRGVKIMERDESNPYSLRFSYNLDHQHLTNRDRTLLKHEDAMREIRKIWYRASLEEIIPFIKETRSLSGDDLFEDLRLGPYETPGDSPEHKKIWQKALSTVYRMDFETLCLASGAEYIDQIVSNWGYKVISDLPEKWESELIDIGLKTADTIARENPVIIPLSGELNADEELNLRLAKLNVKEITKRDDLPPTEIVESLDKTGMTNEIKGLYNSETDKITIARSQLGTVRDATKILLHETVHAMLGEPEGPAFLDYYENKVLELSKYTD